MNSIVRMLRGEEGVSLIEYAFIAVLISIAGVVVIREIGLTVEQFYELAEKAFQ